MSTFYPSNLSTTKEYDKLRQIFESSIHIMQETRNLPIQEIMKIAANKATEITESQIGYFHFVDSDAQTVDLITWSSNTLKYCDVPDKETHYPFKEAGIWIDCIHYQKPVIYNDYPSVSHRKGLPEGHVAVTRILSVPVIEDNKVVAIIGVGNKETDYDDFDEYKLSLLAESVWNIVQRKRAEATIDEVEALLSSREQDNVKLLLDINIQLKKQLAKQESIETVLRRQSEHIKDLQVWGKIGLWQYNPATQKVAWSSTIYTLLGSPHPPTSELSVDIQPAFLTDTAYARFRERLQTVVEQKNTLQYDFEVQLPDNNTRHLMCVMQPIINGEQIVEVQGFFQDFTEWLQEEKMRYELELERERRDILSDFVTQASHEFRTPLSVIKTSSYLISRGSPEKAPEHLASINNQVERLSKLVNNLIEITKLDRDTSLSYESVAIRSVIDEVLNLRHKVITQRNISINTTYNPIPLCVQGIETLLYQALWHIIDNAIRYSHDNSAIHIRTAYNGKDVIVEIEDEGIGIEQQDLPHIFERFFRVDKAHTTEGFGLGLSIAKAVVDLHKGTIKVDSVVNKGTICRIYLPMCRKDN